MKSKRIAHVATGLVLLSITLSAAMLCYLRWYPSSGVPLDELVSGCATYVEQIAADDEVLPSNCEVRRWYLDRVARIAVMDAELQSKQIATPQRALCAYAVRHQARIDARDKMPSRWEVMKLRWRDLTVYGNPDGPTFTSLLPDASEASYLTIIQSAQQTNRAVNESCQNGSL